jgi:hypothetical protein
MSLVQSGVLAEILAQFQNEQFAENEFPESGSMFLEIGDQSLLFFRNGLVVDELLDPEFELVVIDLHLIQHSLQQVTRVLQDLAVLLNDQRINRLKCLFLTIQKVDALIETYHKVLQSLLEQVLNLVPPVPFNVLKVCQTLGDHIFPFIQKVEFVERLSFLQDLVQDEVGPSLEEDRRVLEDVIADGVHHQFVLFELVEGRHTALKQNGIPQ